jgi:N-methylhydantoinase A
VPGPACYRRGGTDATVTDANLVLGILSRQGLLGGALPLEFDAACTAVERVGKQIGVDAVSAAKGIHSIVSANMAQAIRQITVHRGIDPRDCALVAFGGAGPQHAASVAAELGIKHVVVPTNCSVLSAVGLLTADPRITASRTLLTPLDNAAEEDVEQVFKELTAEASSRIGQAADGDLVTERWFGLRYVGQSHDVPIPYGRQPTDLTQRFEAEHQRLFGTQLGDPIEIVDAHVTLTKLRSYPKEIWRRAESGRVEPPGRRRLGLVDEEVDVFQRASLPSHPVAGPCLIEEHDAVTVVPSSVTAAVRTGHLLLEME